MFSVRHRRHGFTLIELLVVIAIIAILAAILFPVFARARAQARKISCTSNLKQLTMGFMMYAQDNDETFPYWNWGENWKNGSKTPNDATSLWCNAIFPYLKNGPVYHCPEDASGLTAAQYFNNLGWFDMATVKGFPIAVQNTLISYGANERVVSYTPQLAAMNKPADTLLVSDMLTPLSGADGYDDWKAAAAANDPNDVRLTWLMKRVAYPKGGNGLPDFWNLPPSGPWLNAWDEQYSQHGGGNNIGFADGHVRFVPAHKCTIALFGVTQ